MKTYIYIDVSNIRYACRWSSGFELDFIKLYRYLKRRYPNAQEIRYYEGISPQDENRKHHFEFLQNRIGYIVCPLWRKSYNMPAKYETFKCKKCGTNNMVKVLGMVRKMKSNVDVYLASDMLECAAKATEPIHIILLTCDGDYAEAIKAALRIRPRSKVTVMATPLKKVNNCLSVRLRHLASELGRKKFKLTDVETIKKYISYE